MELANKHASDPNALKTIFSSLLLICKIFYSLNAQVSCPSLSILLSLCSGWLGKNTVVFLNI